MLKVLEENGKNLKNALQKCQNVIVTKEDKSTEIALSELTKVIFMKLYCEQSLERAKQSTFDSIWLSESKKHLISFPSIFKDTKQYFGDLFFDENEILNISENTLHEVLEELKTFDFRKKIDKISLRNYIISL